MCHRERSFAFSKICCQQFIYFVGGFGSVYKGSLGDGTLIAVKKLDKILPHGEKEFITEVNTIGSMHHMNLVRLCGFCSEGPHRCVLYLQFYHSLPDQANIA